MRKVALAERELRRTPLGLKRAHAKIIISKSTAFVFFTRQTGRLTLDHFYFINWLFLCCTSPALEEERERAGSLLDYGRAHKRIETFRSGAEITQGRNIAGEILLFRELGTSRYMYYVLSGPKTSRNLGNLLNQC
jgi:hypothetical protein